MTAASGELAQSLAELRELARGIHPAVLNHGLAAALESLAARSPVPTARHVRADRAAAGAGRARRLLRRLRGADQRRQVRARRRRRPSASGAHATARLVVEIADDGVGGADRGAGSGLRGLADRVEALGGRLLVDQPAGRGNRRHRGAAGPREAALRPRRRPRAARAATTAGAVRSRATASAASPAAASPQSARIAVGDRGARRRAGAGRPPGTSSARPPARDGDDRQPRRHRLERGEREDLRVARRDERERGAGAQLGELVGVDAAGEAHVGARAAARSAAASGPSPATTSGTPAARHAAIASATPFSARQPPRVERVGARAPRASASANARCTDGITRARPPSGAPSCSQPPQRERARHDERVGAAPASRRCHSASPARVGGRLRARAAAAVQPHARQRVAAVAARAVLAAREAGADGADEPVVVQVQHDARAAARAAASARQPSVGWTLWACTTRAPVRRTAAATSSGASPPRSSPSAARPRPSAAESRSSTSASSPSSVRISHARSSTARSSPPGHAVAVVQQQDHAGSTLSLLRGRGTRRLDPLPDPPPARLPRRRARVRRRAGARRTAPRSSSSRTTPADPATERAGAPRTARATSRSARRAGSTSRATRRSRRPAGDLLCFLDDDVEAWPGWLAALLAAAAAHPGHEAFGGPIRARLEGTRPARLRARAAAGDDARPRAGRPRRRARLGREPRRCAARALERVGGVRPGALGRRATRRSGSGGCAPRAGGSATSRRPASTTAARAPTRASPGLARAAWHRGRHARRYDEAKGARAGVAGELRTLAGCVVAHRPLPLRQRDRARPRRPPAGCARRYAAPAAAPARPSRGATPTYLSGAVAGRSARRAPARAGARRDLAGGRRVGRAAAAPRALRARRARRAPPRRRVHVVGVARPEHAPATDALRRELERSRHDVALHLDAPAPRRRQVGEPPRRARRAPARRRRLAAASSTTTSCCRAGFLDAFLLAAERFGPAARPARARLRLARRLAGHPPPARAASPGARASSRSGP